MIEMTLNGLSMNSQVPDSDGALWYVTDWDGWDGPEIRQATLDPSMVDGTLIADSRYGRRSLSLTGVCKAGSEAGYWLAYNKIASLVTPFANVDLVVEETVSKRVGVRLSGPPKIKSVGQGSFDWTLSLIAEDPRKYAVAATTINIASGATQTFTAVGKAASFPVLETSGNLLLTHTGSSLYIASETGKPLDPSTVIDMRERTVYAGTTNQYDKITPQSAWWAVLPGSNSIVNGGSAAVVLTYHEAWI